MKIRFKNYTITHDNVNYVLNSVYIIGDKGKIENQGNEALRPLKYYSTLKMALKSIRDMSLTDGLDDIDDLNNIIGVMDKNDNEFLEYLNGMDLS